ncbi:hypothetical protein [Arthrobacter woluwensis]|uniref:hypothetical protein n=1 Tax=Arthrobacter woluwensis TaxID=156980 RepID=UPI0011A01CB3|nr:hypothetical protein [Arthrobacter woluwensis]
MPRLTVHEFIKRHQLLRMLWLDIRTRPLFAVLPVRQQWELHDCYRPSDALDNEELASHFATLRCGQPKLLLQAGRHYAVMHRAYLLAPQVDEQSVSPTRGPATVRLIARPHIDEGALAAALAMIESAGVVVDEDPVEERLIE